LDAAQHEAKEVQEVAVVEDNSQPQTGVQAYPDSPHLGDVAKEIDRIPKDVLGNERSLLALLNHAPRVKEKILALHSEHPDYLTLDEVSFKRDHRDVITLVTQRIRVSLWQEYESAIQNNRVMKVQQIFAGTCSESAFYSLIDNPVRLGYILCPPADYIVMLKEAHQAGLEKLRELFSARVVDEEGYMNPKAADMVLKAFALLDARLKGAVVQRVDQRVLTANVPTQGAGGVQAGVPADMQTLELELQKTRQQLEKYYRLPKHPTAPELAEDMKDIVIDVVDMNVNPAIGGSAKVLK
jgi:hypothetical protein